jgi:hypothetical protein
MAADLNSALIYGHAYIGVIFLLTYYILYAMVDRSAGFILIWVVFSINDSQTGTQFIKALCIVGVLFI